jgi:hypothetical protein
MVQNREWVAVSNWFQQLLHVWPAFKLSKADSRLFPHNFLQSNNDDVNEIGERKSSILLVKGDSDENHGEIRPIYSSSHCVMQWQR